MFEMGLRERAVLESVPVRLEAERAEALATGKRVCVCARGYRLIESWPWTTALQALSVESRIHQKSCTFNVLRVRLCFSVCFFSALSYTFTRRGP